MKRGFYVAGSEGNRVYIPYPQEMKELAKIAVEKMIDADFYPDVNIAIANGGVAPARDMDYYFAKLAGHTPEPASIRLKSYDEKAGKLEDTFGDKIKKMNEILPDNENPEKILISDDLADKGRTLRIAKEWAKKQFGNDVEIKTGVLWYKDCSEVVPDFFGKMVSPEWILLYKDFEETYEELRARQVA